MNKKKIDTRKRFRMEVWFDTADIEFMRNHMTREKQSVKNLIESTMLHRIGATKLKIQKLV